MLCSMKTLFLILIHHLFKLMICFKGSSQHFQTYHTTLLPNLLEIMLVKEFQCWNHMTCWLSPKQISLAKNLVNQVPHPYMNPNSFLQYIQPTISSTYTNCTYRSKPFFSPFIISYQPPFPNHIHTCYFKVSTPTRLSWACFLSSHDHLAQRWPHPM